MTLNDLKEKLECIIDNKDLQVSLKLRDSLYRNGIDGIPLSLAKKVASMVTLGSTEDDFIEEVALLLRHLSRIIIPELGEESFLLMLEKMPPIYKD